MISKEELLRLRSLGKHLKEEVKNILDDERRARFVENLQDVVEKLDMRLKTAARHEYLELKLIEVNSPELVDLVKIVCSDSSGRSTWGDGWATVNPYQDKSVLRHPGLVALWERLESYGLRPIFIAGAYGAPIFGVQLPDGGPYPRNDSAKEVSLRTINRLDYWLCEDGGFLLTPFNNRVSVR